MKKNWANEHQAKNVMLRLLLRFQAYKKSGITYTCGNGVVTIAAPVSESTTR